MQRVASSKVTCLPSRYSLQDSVPRNSLHLWLERRQYRLFRICLVHRQNKLVNYLSLSPLHSFKSCNYKIQQEDERSTNGAVVCSFQLAAEKQEQAHNDLDSACSLSEISPVHVSSLSGYRYRPSHLKLMLFSSTFWFIVTHEVDYSCCCRE